MVIDCCSSPDHGKVTDSALVIAMSTFPNVIPLGVGGVMAGVMVTEVIGGTTCTRTIWLSAAREADASIVTDGINPVSSRETISRAA
jgi:hypothetical protein